MNNNDKPLLMSDILAISASILALISIIRSMSDPIMKTWVTIAMITLVIVEIALVVYAFTDKK